MSLFDQVAKILGSNGSTVASVSTKGSKGAVAVELLDSSGNQINFSDGLIPYEYDYISCSYTGSNLTGVVYKTGGASGATVATLTLAYDSSNLITSITRT